MGVTSCNYLTNQITGYFLYTHAGDGKILAFTIGCNEEQVFVSINKLSKINFAVVM